MVGILAPARDLLTPWTKELNVCNVAPLPSPPPSQSNHTVYTDSVWLWGVGVLSCVVDHILQDFTALFLTSCYTTPTKNDH